MIWAINRCVPDIWEKIVRISCWVRTSGSLVRARDGTHRLELRDLNLEHVSEQKQQGVERLFLCGYGYVPLYRQVRQEALQVVLRQIPLFPAEGECPEPAHPRKIGLLGPVGQMPQPHEANQLLFQCIPAGADCQSRLFRPVNRRRLSFLACSAVVPVQPECVAGLANLPVLVAPAEEEKKRGELPALTGRRGSIVSDPGSYAAGRSDSKLPIHSDPAQVMWKVTRIDTPLFLKELGKRLHTPLPDGPMPPPSNITNGRATLLLQARDPNPCIHAVESYRFRVVRFKTWEYNMLNGINQVLFLAVA